MYASRTGTRRNLAALRGAGWRLMVSARGVLRTEGFPYCLDNGAWTAHQQGEQFDVPAFERAVTLLGDCADFIVLPDIVGGGMASLRMSVQWMPRLHGIGQRRLLAVQDGMLPGDVECIFSAQIGIDVGGSTEWKEETMPSWGRVARIRGCWLHVLRVNTIRRIRLCQDAGADSCDGSSASRFAKTIPMLNKAAQQGHLFGGM